MTAKTNVIETAKNPEIQTILDSTASKSSKIRALAALEVPRGEIALLMDIRYQHVRNVLVTKLTGKKEESPKVEMTEDHLKG